MLDVRPGLALAALLLAALTPAGARGEGDAPRRDDAVVDLRFDWPAPLRARVHYHRVRTRTAGPQSSFKARYEFRARREEDGLRISLGGTTWSGDLPFPRALAKQAIRASESVVQEVGPDGEFAGLHGVEAMRPVLSRLFEQAKVPLEAAERAIALAEAGMRAEARDLWNLEVGFWTGASLRVGERYVLQADGEIPLLPGARALHSVEFGVRRRVPCVPRGRALDCVEATIRATPDPGALERVGRALFARLAPGVEPAERADLDLSAESELLLVTEPATLLPRRVVWTKAARLRAGGEGPPLAEETDRSEYEYRYLPPEAPTRRRAPPASDGPAPALEPAVPVEAAQLEPPRPVPGAVSPVAPAAPSPAQGPEEPSRSP